MRWHGQCSSLASSSPSPTTPVPHEDTMKDLIFVSLTVAFFAASWLYAVSFNRL